MCIFAGFGVADFKAWKTILTQLNAQGIVVCINNFIVLPMECLDCLIMCTLYSSCTRVILLCTNLICYVQNVFRYEQATFRYVHNVFRYVHNVFRYAQIYFVMCIMYFVMCKMYFVMCKIYFVMCIMYFVMHKLYFVMCIMTGPRSAVGNVSGYRYVSDCRSRGSIPVRSHTFVEIDHEMISTVILLPSADSFKKGCCQLQAKVCARITG